MKDHRLIDERSLALHRLVAQKLRADPLLLGVAKANLVRWEPSASSRLRPVLVEWSGLAGFGACPSARKDNNAPMQMPERNPLLKMSIHAARQRSVGALIHAVGLLGILRKSSATIPGLTTGKRGWFHVTAGPGPAINTATKVTP